MPSLNDRVLVSLQPGTIRKATAVIKYIGQIKGGEDGVMYGIEIVVCL